MVSLALDFLLPAIVTILFAAILLGSASPVATRLIRLRARRLPPDLADRLEEEWLAELAELDSPLRTLMFGVAIVLTRSKTFVDAAAGELDLAERGVEVSVADVRVPSGISSRVLALLVDTVLLMVVSWAVSRQVNPQSVYALFSSASLAIVWLFVVQIYIVTRFGGSPGKRLFKLRIATVDGTPLTHRHAALRVLPNFLFMVVNLLAITTGMFLTGADAPGMNMVQRQQLITAAMPIWFVSLYGVAQFIWAAGEFGSFYSTEEHRALHDHIAGTIVLMDVPRVVVALDR